MNVFVSGKFNDKQFIREKMDELEKLGCIITYDWTKVHNTTNNYDLRMAAIFDINGVQKCDVHVVIISDKDYEYRGTFCELGCSIGLNKKILLWNPFDDAKCMDVPFYHHSRITHYETWNELVEGIEKIIMLAKIYINET